MSYKDFEKALKLVNEIKESGIFYLAKTPQTIKSIADAENILQVKFPRSYKVFLEKFGSLDIGSESIFGITGIDHKDNYIYEDIISNTLELRKYNHEPVIPSTFIPIYALGNGEIYCLDTAQMNGDEGECPIIAWYFGRTEKIYEDFGSFLLEQAKDVLVSFQKKFD